MRASILMLAAAILALNLGCTRRSVYYGSETAQAPRQASAPTPPPAPRTNLYPLTSPPPGSVQPLQGYAPTRITAGTYDAPTGGAYYADTADMAAGGTYGTYSTGYPGSTYAGGYTTAPATYTTGGYTAQPVGFGAGDPFPSASSAAFCPPGGESCTVEEVTPYMNPIVPIKDPPVIFTPPAPGTANTIYASTTTYQGGYTQPTTAPAVYTSPPSQYSAAGYTAPPSLSATTTYGSVPYGGGTTAASYTTTSTSSYGGGYVPTGNYGTTTTLPNGMTTTTTYGQVEGTADIAIPLPSAGYGRTPAPLYGTTAPAYGAPTPGYGATTNASYTTTSTTTSGYGAYPTIRSPSVPVSAGAAIAASAINAKDIRLVPALDIPPGNHPGDAGPSQWFEVVRQGNGPIRIGRMSATCVCVGVRIPKRTYEAGERVLIEARMLKRPPQNNLTYGLYVNIVEPLQTVVDTDVTLSW